MSMKSWVLGRVQGINGVVGRADLPARDEPGGIATQPGGLSSTGGERSVLRSADPVLAGSDHLGAYAPLIAAIRDELEHFVASHVRQHVVIAERDRFLLTSIAVRCADAAEARQSLQRFMTEFKPEQVKRYLAREVIGGLANAAVIDLSQFAGLADADAPGAGPEGADGDYRELLAALRSTPASAAPPPYEVSVVGRWTEADAARPAARDAGSASTPATPLAGRRCELDIDDRGGRRRAVLNAVIAGRRYSIGKGEGCDLRVDGTYTSRRHAEIWSEGDAWFVVDAGSTNGIRVESDSGVQGRSGPAGSAGGSGAPIEFGAGVRIVLSAEARGPTGDYPTLALRPAASAAASQITPIAAFSGAAGAGRAVARAGSRAGAPAGPGTAADSGTAADPGAAADSGAAPKTPLTAVLPARPGELVYEITTSQAGMRALALRSSALPVTIGRSRNQTLVVDRRHEGVSGHHVEIVAIEAAGAAGIVHGDNGILLAGVHHAVGARFCWQPGETMLLGASALEQPACSLVLTRLAEA